MQTQSKPSVVTVYKSGLHTLSKLLHIFGVSIRKFLDSTPLEATVRMVSAARGAGEAGDEE